MDGFSSFGDQATALALGADRGDAVRSPALKAWLAAA
jgi:hypothetical protein